MFLKVYLNKKSTFFAGLYITTNNFAARNSEVLHAGTVDDKALDT
jgi:hypothetical protein